MFSASNFKRRMGLLTYPFEKAEAEDRWSGCLPGRPTPFVFITPLATPQHADACEGPDGRVCGKAFEERALRGAVRRVGKPVSTT
jgi:hypothetical protein